jgi:hypothetical protein
MLPRAPGSRHPVRPEDEAQVFAAAWLHLLGVHCPASTPRKAESDPNPSFGPSVTTSSTPAKAAKRNRFPRAALFIGCFLRAQPIKIREKRRVCRLDRGDDLNIAIHEPENLLIPAKNLI